MPSAARERLGRTTRWARGSGEVMEEAVTLRPSDHMSGSADADGWEGVVRRTNRSPAARAAVEVDGVARVVQNNSN